MELERYASTRFGEARRTIGRHGYVAYFPRSISRSYELPGATVRLLADAEASLGRLAGVASLLPNPHLLIRPYLLREALASTRIEGTQASMLEVLEVDAAGEQPNADVEEVLNYVDALELGREQLKALPLGLRLIRGIHARLMGGAGACPAADRLGALRQRGSRTAAARPECALARAVRDDPSLSRRQRELMDVLTDEGVSR